MKRNYENLKGCNVRCAFDAPDRQTLASADLILIDLNQFERTERIRRKQEAYKQSKKTTLYIHNDLKTCHQMSRSHDNRAKA